MKTEPLEGNSGYLVWREYYENIVRDKECFSDEGVMVINVFLEIVWSDCEVT